jgi:hypothetical protein
MQIIVKLAIQNAKTGSGEIMIGGRCPSEHCIKSPSRPKRGWFLDTTCSSCGWSRGKKLELRFSDKECRHRRLIRIVVDRPSGVTTCGRKGVGDFGRGLKARASQRVGRSEVGTDLNALLI